MVPPPPYKDYIPGPDADALTWMQGLSLAYLATGLTVPAAIGLGLLVAGYETALLASTNGATRGPATIQTKDDARAAAELVCRLAAQAMVASYKNGDLTATELTDGGVRVPSAVQTPRIPPVAGPDLGLRKITPGMIALTIFDPMSSEFRKPIGVVAAEIWGGAWSGDPLVPPTVFGFLGPATRKVYNLSTAATLGSKVRYRARWVTVRGAVSPFGADLDAYSA